METECIQNRSTDITVLRDVTYLEPERNEKVDIYLPPARYQRPSPAVLMIHGGGWRVGDKASKREVNICTQLAEAGFATFSINYLLNEGYRDENNKVQTTKVAWPQNLHDCWSGLRFMRKEAEQYGIDPDRIGVMGGSAGGTFAMLLGASGHDPRMCSGGLYTEQRNDLACIIDFYGPTNLETDHYRPVFAGATDEETTENLRLMSPLHWLRADLPPILIAHGTADTTVSVEVSRDLTRRLQEVGADYRYIEIAGAPHTFHLQPEQMNLRGAVVDFLTQHLGAPALES